ncbi:MAG TPA: hypothetical protein VF772_25540 [Terriglobales bacterium]
MIWLKSISMGLVAVLIFAIIAVLAATLVSSRQGGMTAFMPLVAARYLSTWVFLAAVFLLGFGWELWRLGY